jgi:hypothetical protein
MPKKYSEDEVRELLYAALQLQEEARAREHAASGLTLDEVTEIADEVGIDPAFIIAAAKKSAEEDSQERKTGLLGQTKVLTMKHTLDGVLSPERTEQIVRRLRKVMGGRGDLNDLGSHFEWTIEKADGEGLRVNVRSDENSTDVTFVHTPKRTGAGEWIPPLMPLIFPLVILLSGGPLVAFVMFTLFASLMTGMTLSATRKKIKSNDARDRRKLEGLLAGMESILAPGPGDSAVRTRVPASSGRIDPSVLQDSGSLDQETRNPAQTGTRSR